MSSTSKQFSFGDIREDGFIFAKYNKFDKPVWYSPKAFHKDKITTAWHNAKKRAEKKNIPFDIDTDYLMEIFPKDNKCPIFGIDLVWGGERKTSPSLDRIHPHLGYVRGNLVWVSDYANTLKAANSLDTLRTLLTFYERLEGNHEGKRTH
jgi:hypothetical protein